MKIPRLLWWIGSKERYWEKWLCPCFPNAFIKKEVDWVYCEPFLGSCVIPFRIQPQRAWLSDINCALISMYITVRNHANDLITQGTKEFENFKQKAINGAGKEAYYILVEEFNNLKEKVEPYANFLNENTKEIVQNTPIMQRITTPMQAMFTPHSNQHITKTVLSTCDTMESSKIIFSKQEFVRLAVLMLLLNRVCRSGMYQVDSKNRFNTSYFGDRRIQEGEYPCLFPTKAVMYATQYFNSSNDIHLRCESYELAIERFIRYTTTTKNKMVYFDPPYYSGSSKFNEYTATSKDFDQQKLANLAKQLCLKNIYVCVTNDGHVAMQNMYNFMQIYINNNVKRDIARSTEKWEKRESCKRSEIIACNWKVQEIPDGTIELSDDKEEE